MSCDDDKDSRAAAASSDEKLKTGNEPRFSSEKIHNFFTYSHQKRISWRILLPPQLCFSSLIFHRIVSYRRLILLSRKITGKIWFRRPSSYGVCRVVSFLLPNPLHFLLNYISHHFFSSPFSRLSSRACWARKSSFCVFTARSFVNNVHNKKSAEKFAKFALRTHEAAREKNSILWRDLAQRVSVSVSLRQMIQLFSIIYVEAPIMRAVWANKLLIVHTHHPYIY